MSILNNYHGRGSSLLSRNLHTYHKTVMLSPMHLRCSAWPVYLLLASCYMQQKDTHTILIHAIVNYRTSGVFVGFKQIQKRVRVIPHEYRSRQTLSTLSATDKVAASRSPWRCDRACQAARLRHFHAGRRQAGSHCRSSATANTRVLLLGLYAHDSAKRSVTSLSYSVMIMMMMMMMMMMIGLRRENPYDVTCQSMKTYNKRIGLIRLSSKTASKQSICSNSTYSICCGFFCTDCCTNPQQTV